MQNFKYDIDRDGIATFLFDVPGRTMNTLTAAAVDELDEIVAIIREERVTGAVLASGKSNGFCAGADLGELGETTGMGLQGDALASALQRSSRMSWALRALETVGKPVVAALEGLALGGGFELALAAHYRVASAAAKVGFPEVTIGLLPGAGGTQRTPRLAGVRTAIDLLIGGAPIDAARAHEIKLIDEIVASGATVEAAKAWIRAGGQGIAPWDRKGYKTPDGPYTEAGAGVFALAAAQVHGKSYGNYPAQRNILRCVYEGFGLPMDAALRVEARLFLACQQTAAARAMIRTNFISRQALSKGAARPDGFPPFPVRKVAVLGAGMMGAGIAYVQARAGIETVLIDTSQQNADKGKSYSAGLLDKAVMKGSLSRADADAILGRILATTDYQAIDGADLVVEAVFEDRALKADVTARAEARLAASAVFASNTSTLPITELAAAATRPANFIGIHFFSPVDRMDLVEVILGKQTSTDTLAKALDYCKALKKVPIVVNDSRGFYTSRTFETYITEGIEMLLEGIAPAIIDNVGRMTGMPRGPLELADDVAIDLLDRIFRQRRADYGRPEPTGGTERVLIDMVGAGRLGRKNGQGFYDYPQGAPKRLWKGLAERFPLRVTRSSPELIEKLKRRLLYRQAIEAARCMDERVVTTARDADVGATLGWGFAAWTGGPMSLIDSVGVKEFVERTQAFQAEYGARFEPPPLLLKMAAEGRSFYPVRSESAA